MKRLLACLAGCAAFFSLSAQEPADYVNPFIGTTNFGTCNPGAICPNGMMSVVPFNVMGSDENTYDKDARWWSTPYEYTNSFFTGFAHVNLSGVGCPELGSLLLMPTTGELDVDYHNYGSKYEKESANPGYYTISLTKYNVVAEATATPRTGLTRFTFPEGKSNILLNLGEGLTNESGAYMRRVSDTEVEGMKVLGTFCYNPQAVFPIYFVMRVSKAPQETGYWKKQRPMTGVEAEWDKDQGKYKLYTKYNKDIAGDDIGAWFTFDTKEGEQIEVAMGVSFVSIENARENLEKEQHGRHFEAIHQEARQRWNDDLGRIMVEGGTDDQRTVLYTALYHFLIHPNILNDINKVRARVGMPSLPSTVYPASAFDSKDKMRIQIMHERTCELAGESWRWLDLDRWFFRDMDGDGIKETMLDSYQIDGKTPLEWLQSRDSEFDEFEGVSVSYRAFRFPIPSRELPLVDGLDQNPGW